MNCRKWFAVLSGLLCLEVLAHAEDTPPSPANTVAPVALATVATDLQTGWQIVTLQAGHITARLCPQAGANVFSIVFHDREILKTPPRLQGGAGFGVPVLYPTPNRVRDSRFTFEGREYRFPANERTHFLHGLAVKQPWELVRAVGKDEEAIATCQLEFVPETPLFTLFPHRHALTLEVRVQPNAVRWTYTVHNTDDKRLPFGFALHPWFLYQGPRAQTFLTLHAPRVWETEGLLPTGKLLAVTGSPMALQHPKNLEDFLVDDVWQGVDPQKPTMLEFRGATPPLTLTLQASPDFQNAVVYAPAKQPWVCVENQTCATDAHNLQARGIVEANLLVVEPGQKQTGFVELRLSQE